MKNDQQEVNILLFLLVAMDFLRLSWGENNQKDFGIFF